MKHNRAQAAATIDVADPLARYYYEPPRSNILNNVRVVLEDGRHIFGEVQCHHEAILEYNEKSHAHDHYGES